MLLLLWWCFSVRYGVEVYHHPHCVTSSTVDWWLGSNTQVSDIEFWAVDRSRVFWGGGGGVDDSWVWGKKRRLFLIQQMLFSVMFPSDVWRKLHLPAYINKKSVFWGRAISHIVCNISLHSQYQGDVGWEVSETDTSTHTVSLNSARLKLFKDTASTMKKRNK